MAGRPRLGATYLGNGQTQFLVWAPHAESVDVHIMAPSDQIVPLNFKHLGYYERVIEGVEPGAQYFIKLNRSREFPDPVSRFQPEGVHGPSAVVDDAFDWSDANFTAPRLRDCVIYELHVGTFTPEGTFDAVIPHLNDLRELGVNMIELMPVAQFPGSRNWGYDGVYPFAVQNSYGGPFELKRLVNKCHQNGIGVILDVVYNHLGPEGNYLREFGPYFTAQYRTPWGDAINFDHAYSDEVRRYFIENALQWTEEFHIDALRLDAVHAIYDMSARHFLAELADAVHEAADRKGRRVAVISESDLGDPKIVTARELGGFGHDAQWSDDLHHAIHALVTGESAGYYADFGMIEHLVRAYRYGFTYTGQYSVHRRRRHGAMPHELPPERFVVCIQNHDQIGNRMLGERIGTLIGFEKLKTATAAMILSPFVPLLFMGQDYGDPAPFLYFVSHEDPDLIEAVRRGRKEEFESFKWEGEPPDPQSELTFNRSKLNQRLRFENKHRQLNLFTRELLQLRKRMPAHERTPSGRFEPSGNEARKTFWVLRSGETSETYFCACNFSDEFQAVEFALSSGRWELVLNSTEHRWGGPGGEVSQSLNSEGEALLTLPPNASIVYRRAEAS